MTGHLLAAETTRDAATAGPEGERAGLIRARVEAAAAGRIRDLSVACSGGRVTLRGRSRTQYAKQLAHQAALELVGGRVELVNRIEVVRDGRAPGAGWDDGRGASGPFAGAFGTECALSAGPTAPAS